MTKPGRQCMLELVVWYMEDHVFLNIVHENCCGYRASCSFLSGHLYLSTLQDNRCIQLQYLSIQLQVACVIQGSGTWPWHVSNSEALNDAKSIAQWFELQMTTWNFCNRHIIDCNSIIVSNKTLGPRGITKNQGFSKGDALGFVTA